MILLVMVSERELVFILSYFNFCWF